MAKLVALALICALAIEAILCTLVHHNESVRDLLAEPDYRAVRLRWTCQLQKGFAAFDIKYCEITNWQSKNRCKEQQVRLTESARPLTVDTDEPVIRLISAGKDTFEASITNLRMLTNYSITVQAQYDAMHLPHNPAAQSVTPIRNQVFVETKSFAAKTSRCLANSSDIEVQTGPYFRGKISVEGSSNASCAMFGNRSSEQSVYVFRINHEQCGSKVLNNTRIETMVIVHENKEILTHNSRRYMVVCTFTPEIFSLTASVAVPNHLLKKFFDRIREKQFQLSTNSRNEAINSIHEPVSNSLRVDKVGKTKRFSVRREELHSSPVKQSHLRDSRMLTEDARAKWLKQVDNLESEPRTTHKWRLHKFAVTNQLAMLSAAMAMCAVALLYTVARKCTLHRCDKAIRHQKQSLSSELAKDCQLVPAVCTDKVVSQQGKPVQAE